MKTTSDSTGGRTRLGYAPPVPWHRRRGFRRLLYAALPVGLCAAAALFAWPRWGQPAVARARVVHRDYQWSTFRAPADRVVFAEHADFAAPLTEAVTGRRLGNYKAYDAAVGGPTGQPPQCLELWQVDPTHGAFDPAPSSVGYNSYAFLYLHGRTTPAGRRCIVILKVRGRALPSGGYPSVGRTLDFPYAVIERSSALGGPGKRIGEGEWSFGKRGRTMGDPLRFYAGQPDAEDPSHFTVRYEYGSKTGVLHGYLRDDGSLRLEDRDGTLPLEERYTLNARRFM